MESCEVDTFESEKLALSDVTLRGIYAYGFEAPSPIQQKALLPILRGSDVIVQAQSGTGKTAAFGIAVCEKLARANTSCHAGRAPCAIVICHTRELALQTTQVLQGLTQYTDIVVALIVGGIPHSEQIETLRRGVDVAVATPGRLNVLMEKERIALANVKLVIIDEVDEVLKETPTNSFLPIVQSILANVPGSAQLVMVSATVPDTIDTLLSDLLRNPHKIVVPPSQLPLKGIQQFRIDVDEFDKLEALLFVMSKTSSSQTIVFCQRKDQVDAVARHLQKANYPTCTVHSDCTASERLQAMQQYRNGEAMVLVATEVLARGIDVQQIGLVVLYDLCHNVETYLHCVGRCGRYGRQGSAIVFVAPCDEAPLRSIETYYSMQLGQYCV